MDFAEYWKKDWLIERKKKKQRKKDFKLKKKLQKEISEVLSDKTYSEVNKKMTLSGYQTLQTHDHIYLW